MTSSTLRPTAYVALKSATDEWLAERSRDPTLAQARLQDAFVRYLTHGWRRFDPARLSALGEEEKSLVEPALRKLDTSIESIWPGDESDIERHSRFVPRISELAVLSGERIVAMRMAEVDEVHVRLAARMLTERLLDAHLVGRIHQIALLRRVSPELLAPSAIAAVMNELGHLAGRASHIDPAAELQRLGLDTLSALPASDQHAVAQYLGQAIHQAGSHVTEVIQSYDHLSRDRFWRKTPDVSESAQALGRAPAVNPGGEIYAGTLVAFAGSARGGSDAARVEGALDLYRSVVSVARIRSGNSQAVPSRHAMMGAGLRGLHRLSAIVRNERYAHRLVEDRWGEIEREMSFLKMRNPKAPAVLPLPEDMEALECISLYFQDQAARGVPLGKLLADMHGSTLLTFGPTERRFLTRLTTYAARKYAANLAAHEHPRVAEIEASGLRKAEVVRLLAGVEWALRDHESQPDQDLLEMGHAQFCQLASDGHLRRDEGEIGLGLLDEMITRVRAGQEVRYLSGFLAHEREVPADILAAYASLPHTRRFALLGAPESRASNMYARNGEPLREFESDILGRWLRYRQQSPIDRDVKLVELRYGEGVTEFTQASKAARRPFHRSLREMIPSTDDEVEQEAEAQEAKQSSRGYSRGKKVNKDQVRNRSR